MRFVFDISRLGPNFGIRWCGYHLYALAEIAIHHGHEAIMIMDDPARHAYLWIAHNTRAGISRDLIDGDIYVAKSNTYYFAERWAGPSHLKAFKVCLCTSDALHREKAKSYWGSGTPIHINSDLCFVVNHSSNYISHPNVIPMSHMINVALFKELHRIGLGDAYLLDDLTTIRHNLHKPINNNNFATFIGNDRPLYRRRSQQHHFPSWVDAHWTRSLCPSDYVKLMLKYPAFLDLMGNGEKNIRFTEGIMLGMLPIVVDRVSQYNPKLVHNHNCVKLRDWSHLNSVNPHSIDVDRIVHNATNDYKKGWSLLSLFRIIIDHFNNSNR